jgi:HAD superfamily hydrolase (TIGR01509 family)
MQQPELVIFDNDGVLVDSLDIAHQVIVDMTAELTGHQLSDEMIHRLRGGKMADIFADIEATLGVKLPESFLEEYRARCYIAFDRDLKAIRGVAEVIDALPWPFCVASSGPKKKIEVTLKSVGLLDRFEGKVFSSYDIESWKPDPGIFLHAASTMGAEPDRCVVIEDSATGVLGAVAAGMRVLGYAEGREGDELLEAGSEAVFHDMAELPGLLGLRKA